MEQWKDIKGYEGSYQVSTLGNVKSLSREMYNGQNYYMSKERILRPRTAKDKSHYASVMLRKNGCSRTIAIHRLVAEAFIPRIPGKNYVNHKDENKLNNNVENLEWVTPKENLNYGNYQQRKGASRSTPVVGTHRDTGRQLVIMTAEEARTLGLNKNTISAMCARPSCTYKGYYWRKLAD